MSTIGKSPSMILQDGFRPEVNPLPVERESVLGEIKVPERKSLRVFSQQMNALPEEDLQNSTMDGIHEIQKPSRVSRLANSSFFWSAAILLVCVTLLYLSRPQFTLKKPENEFEKPTTNHVAIWTIGVTLSVIVAVIPFIIQYMNNKKASSSS